MLADLLARSRRLIGANPAGFIDDSEDGAGARYDIYSADVYLFTEPFAADLEPLWSRGARAVGDLVTAVATRDGSAMPWGRSLGVLGVCHTIELAALVLTRGLTDDAGRWLALAQNALDQFPAWSDGALLTAHTRRSQNTYRGPDRWLQLTFDCLGKLAWAAELFASVELATAASPSSPSLPRDELVRFEPDRHAAVWTYRSPAIAFVLPFVGPAWADYLPAPRNPGLYEVPVDAPLPTFVPTITANGDRFVAGGLPVELRHESGRDERPMGRLSARHARLAPRTTSRTTHRACTRRRPRAARPRDPRLRRSTAVGELAGDRDRDTVRCGSTSRPTTDIGST